MATLGLQEKCHVYLEKGQKQWDSYFSKWEDLAQNEEGVDENLLVDSEDELPEVKPPIKKSGNKKITSKLSTIHKLRNKCRLTLNKKRKKNKGNLNVEDKEVALTKFSRQQNLEQNHTDLNEENREGADLRMHFLETLAACSNNFGIFGILSRAFSCHKTMMNGSFGFDRLGVMPAAVNTVTTNITFNINSNFARESRSILMNKTENAVLNFPLSHNHVMENGNESGGSQFSFPRKPPISLGFQNGAILDSIGSPNFTGVNFRCETPKNNFTVSRNCFSENFDAKRKFSRLNFVSDEDERIKRFRSSYLDLEEKTPPPPSAPQELIKSRDLISSMKKDSNFETPKSKKSLRLCSSENAGTKNKKGKSRMKLLVDSDDDEEDESSWSSKSSLKIFCTPKSNKKTENDGMGNSDSDECEAIFESVKKK